MNSAKCMHVISSKMDDNSHEITVFDVNVIDSCYFMLHACQHWHIIVVQCNSCKRAADIKEIYTPFEISPWWLAISFCIIKSIIAHLNGNIEFKGSFKFSFTQRNFCSVSKTGIFFQCGFLNLAPRKFQISIKHYRISICISILINSVCNTHFLQVNTFLCYWRYFFSQKGSLWSLFAIGKEIFDSLQKLNKIKVFLHFPPFDNLRLRFATRLIHFHWVSIFKM